MDQEKCNVIKEYLMEELLNSQIDQADISDNQHYRISLPNGLLMLKVGSEFIEDNSKEDIIEKMKNWNVPRLLRENSKLGVLVTDSGPSTYKRD